MSESNDDDSKGLVGLQNLGNTCYINSALQALSNCQQLTRFVLDYSRDFNDKVIFKSYSELIEEIWNCRGPPYVIPSSFIRNIRCIYPAFRGCTQQDTQEFLRCFLEQLHDELKVDQQQTSSGLGVSNNNNTNKKNNIEQSTSGDNISSTTNVDDDGGDEPHDMAAATSTTITTATDDDDDDDDDDGDGADDTDDTDSGNDNNNNHKPSRSVISDIFEFKISSSVVCSTCRNISTRKETFKDLSIPIPSRDHPYYQEAENDEQETNTSLLSWLYYSIIKWFWGPQVTLQDCLSIFFGTDSLEGDNEYSCEVCTKKNRGVKYLKVLELPEILCIHFKRYETVGSTKITTHVSFPLTGLDLAPFMSENSQQPCTTYRLIACICHHGTALMTGHYTTYALNCYDDQWYEFDDEYVTSVEDYQVKNSEAYILFYQKSTMEE